MPNDGLETTSTKSAAGRTRPTVTSPLASSACNATDAGSTDDPDMYAWAPSMTRASDARGDGGAGSMRRSQLRTTSLARSGVPSENDRSGRRWKTIRCPPSSTRHASASAGCSWRFPSNVVRVSKSCAVIAELSASPWAAGSSVVGAPTRMRTGRSAPTAAAEDPTRTAAEMTRAASNVEGRDRRRIGGSIRAGRRKPFRATRRPRGRMTADPTNESCRRDPPPARHPHPVGPTRSSRSSPAASGCTPADRPSTATRTSATCGATCSPT